MEVKRDLIADHVPNPEPFGKSSEEASIFIEENPSSVMFPNDRYLPSSHYSSALERFSTSSRFQRQQEFLRYNNELAEITARMNKPTSSATMVTAESMLSHAEPRIAEAAAEFYQQRNLSFDAASAASEQNQQQMLGQLYQRSSPPNYRSRLPQPPPHSHHYGYFQ